MQYFFERAKLYILTVFYLDSAADGQSKMASACCKPLGLCPGGLNRLLLSLVGPESEHEAGKDNSSFTVKMLVCQALANTNAGAGIWLSTHPAQSPSHRLPQNGMQSWVQERAGQTYRHDVLTLHGYCRTEGEQKLEEFIREREKRKTILMKAADTPHPDKH